MTERDGPVTEGELHAFVDDALPADRIAAVQSWLASHPEDAARVASWRLQATLLRERYGGIAEEPVPARLERLARRGRTWLRGVAAAVVAAFVAGGLVGWVAGYMLEGASAFKTLTAEALDAHRLYVVEVRHPVEVPGSEAAHLVQWLSKRLDAPLRAPDLAAQGLRLVGGRLLPGPTGPAAFFMYEGSSGDRFTLYCSREKTKETAMHYVATGPVGAYSWIDRTIGYVLSGPADRERLLAVARSAYDQIDRRATQGRLENRTRMSAR